MVREQDLYAVTTIIQLNNGACLRIQAFEISTRIEKISISCLARLSIRSRREINKFIFI